MQSGGFLSKGNPLSICSFNTDGVSYLKSSSKQNFWPMFLVINELSPRPRQDRIKLLMRISNGSVLFFKDYWMLYIWKQLLKSWGSLLCKIIPTFLSYLILFKLLCCYNQEVTHQVLRKMPLIWEDNWGFNKKKSIWY